MKGNAFSDDLVFGFPPILATQSRQLLKDSFRKFGTMVVTVCSKSIGLIFRKLDPDFLVIFRVV